MKHVTGQSRGAALSELLPLVVVALVAGGLAGYWIARSAGKTSEPKVSTMDPGEGSSSVQGVTSQGRQRPFTIEPAVIDFGTINIAEKQVGTVTITNTGVDPVRLLTVKPSCKCTTVGEYDNTIIQPGSSLEVRARVDGQSVPGPTESELRFLFEDHGLVSVRLLSLVTRAVNCMPPFVTIESIASGELVLASMEGTPFRVLAINDREPLFTIGDGSPGMEHRIAWDLSGYSLANCLNAEGERMPKWLVIETDHPGAPLIDVRVRNVQCTMLDLPTGGRTWWLADSRVVLGEISRGETVPVTVPLKWLSNRLPSDRITRVVSEDPEFETTLVDVTRENDETLIRIEITPTPEASGLVYGIARFYASKLGHSQEFWVMARIREESLTISSP